MKVTKSIAKIEREIMKIIRENSIFTDEIRSRPIRYANERKEQPKGPFVIMKFIGDRAIARQSKHYFEEGNLLQELIVTPTEITFSFQFIGGNARGELSTFLQIFWSEDSMNLFKAKNISYIKNSSIIDISEDIGDMEQRASADVTFYANVILARQTLIGAIDEVDYTGEFRDSSGNLVEEIETKVTR